jgi:hypothetical protein
VGEKWILTDWREMRMPYEPEPPIPSKRLSMGPPYLLAYDIGEGEGMSDESEVERGRTKQAAYAMVGAN